MSRVCLYFKRAPERDRWLPGDRFVRPAIRRLIRGKPHPGGPGKVFINLCLGLERLGVHYEVNLPFDQLKTDDRVGVIGGVGGHVLDGYDRPNLIVAGPGLMTHPSEWPTLCEEYPIKYYVQHCEWAAAVYRPYFGEARCAIWPVGIDTDTWTAGDPKDIDLLVYDKIRWDRGPDQPELVRRVLAAAARRNLKSVTLRYGAYKETDYRDLLRRARAMVFLCEHESQGIGCQECLSSDVPVLAWDQGFCLDPNRFAWGDPVIPATSVPHFDARCGERFAGLADFEEKLDLFVDRIRAQAYRPRDYILENLTLAASARHFLTFFDN